MKKYTNITLFREVCRILKEEGKIPDILDYSSPPLKSEETELLTDELECTGTVSIGSSEGLYADFRLSGTDAEGNRFAIPFGTCKTLYNSYDAYRTMCILVADIVFATHNFISEHEEEFVRTGYTVTFYYNGKPNCRLFTSNKENADKKASHAIFNGPYQKVVIRNNASGKEREITA